MRGHHDHAGAVYQADRSSRGTILFLGGDAAYLFNFRGPLMQTFRDRGYRVVAVAQVLNGFDTERFLQHGIEFIPWQIRKAGLNPLSELATIADLRRILKLHRPDILFAHTIKPVIYGLLLGSLCRIARRTVMIPGLGYAFTPERSVKRRIVGVLARLAYRLTLPLADQVIFHNQDDIDLFRSESLLGRRQAAARVNGSGVDIAHFDLQPFPAGPPIFLLVARLLRDKGIEDFVAAASLVKQRFPAARFVLVGGADSNPMAVPQATIAVWKEEGVVELAGHVEDIRPYYAAAHIFVLPAHYREGLPRATLEAMATGRAVITTDVPGCRDTVIDGETGILIPPRNVTALAAAMTKLAQDLPWAAQMGKAGRRLCEQRFELASVTMATLALVAPPVPPAAATPLLSICVPTYNRRDRVLSLARRVLAEAGEFELCVHVDGSTDGTLEALREIHDPRLLISHGPNLGPANAFQAARRASSGRFVIFLNDDEMIYPSGLQTVLADCRCALPPNVGGYIYHLDDVAGSRIGSAFQVQQCNFLALRADYGVVGDKREVVLASLLDDVGFKPGPACFLSPKSLDWSRIALTMNVICREVSIGRAWYLPDGISARIGRLKFADAFPMFLLYLAHLSGYFRGRYRSGRFALKAVLGVAVYGPLALAQGLLRHGR